MTTNPLSLLNGKQNEVYIPSQNRHFSTIMKQQNEIQLSANRKDKCLIRGIHRRITTLLNVMLFKLAFIFF